MLAGFRINLSVLKEFVGELRRKSKSRFTPSHAYIFFPLPHILCFLTRVRSESHSVSFLPLKKKTKQEQQNNQTAATPNG